MLKLKINQQHPLPTRIIKRSHSGTRKMAPDGNLDVPEE